jgi:hypothetical protein
MQRMIIVAIVLVANASRVNAQTFDEWFKQKETQIKYLVEQIGALKAYGEVINKGYDIAHNGLENVFNSKEGDYGQHHNYFLSLWKVKPGVKSYGKVLSILDMKAGIEKQYRLIRSSTTEFLNDEERSYVNSVYLNLASGCNDLDDELKMAINNDQMQLKDDERIQRIDKIYLDMQDRYQFSRSFVNEIKLLVLSRSKQRNDVNKSYSLYGIK